MKSFAVLYESQFGDRSISLSENTLEKAIKEAERLLMTKRKSNACYLISYADEESGKCGIIHEGILRY